MAETYAWVEHHCASLDSRGRKTEKWVLEQQLFYNVKPKRIGQRGSGDVAEEDDAREEEALRFASRREDKMRIIEEELKQIESRIRHRLEVEKERMATHRLRISTALKEREKNQRAKADQAIRDAWRKYEQGWEQLASSGEVSFSTFPWPMVSRPRTVEEITPREVELFLLSPLHSPGQSKRARAKRAQLFWHPDRFRRILEKVDARDKGPVEAGAGIVARCLNDLMV
jgi:hypothetical protein